MRVGYFAFELSASHLLKRYSDDNLFSDNFLIFEIDPRLPPPKGVNFQDLILQEIEQAIIEDGIEVVVIDSLTAMPDATKDALELMRKLRLLKMRQNISMLVIGHTPKRDLSRPLTEDDMADLKHLINFCDSVFALGKSVKGKNVRYLKQIKCSSVELKYGSGNVATFRLVKRDRLNGF
jgi:archaellum biogenesis ATPase FlaH